MNSHFDLSDLEFERAFRNCTLSPSVFSHEAHLRLAWIHITKYGVDKAEKNIQEQLENYVTHVGATDKYHKTLTVVAIRVVNHFMRQSKTDNFKSFIVENPQLKTKFKSLIESHYSFDIFTSVEARAEFLKPDLLTFD